MHRIVGCASNAYSKWTVRIKAWNPHRGLTIEVVWSGSVESDDGAEWVGELADLSLVVDS